MKVLLQNEDTRLYYGGENQWVTRVTEALNLVTVEKAAQKALQCHELALSVVLKFEQPEYELAINPAFCVPGYGERRPVAAEGI